MNSRDQSQAAPQGDRLLTIAVIGGGAAGAAAATELGSLARAAAAPLGIDVIDPCASDTLGTGVAWNPKQAEHWLVNMEISTIGTYRGHVDEIARAVAESAADPGDPFPPRREVGKVLATTFMDTLNAPDSGLVRLRHRRTRARDIRVVEEGGLRVRVGDLELAYDAAILATGNTPGSAFRHLTGCPGYVNDIWDGQWVSWAAGAEHVLIGGSSVSAVDAAMALIEAGHEGPVTMFSRHGCIPGARPLQQVTSLRTLRGGTITALVRSQGRRLSFDDVKQLVCLELIAQGVDVGELTELIAMSKRPSQEWLRYTLARCGTRSLLFGVMKALDGISPEIWHHCTPETQERLAPMLGTFASVQWPMAPRNAVRILSYLESGQLDIRGSAGEPAWDGERFVVRFEDGGDASAKIFANASGIGGKLQDFDCELVRAMRRRGLIVPHPIWGARADFDTGRLLDSSGRPTSPIWATASALTRGVYLVTNELAKACHSARVCASAAFDHVNAVIRNNS